MEIRSTKRDRWNRALGPRSGRKRKKPINDLGDTQPVIDTFFSCRLKTSDWWSPNLVGSDGQEDEVQVSIIGWSNHYKAGQLAYRISVWGGDDTGLERDYLYEETTPTDLFRLVLSFPESLTKSWLREQGFYGA